MGTKMRALAAAAIAAALAGAVTGCSSCGGERFGLSGGKGMDDDKALRLLEQAEASGALESGMEIEHYVAGGLPPPHYRSEQFRLIVREGKPVFWFVTPDFKANVKEGESFPRHIYVLPATPDEVRTIARLVRATGAFDSAPPPEPAGRPPVHDRLRTEVLVILDGKEAKRVYPGAEPPELHALQQTINPLIARIKARGQHRIER